MTKTHPALAETANEIATAIRVNCESFNLELIDAPTWDAEQSRLWALAAKLGCAASVMRLVAPSLTSGGVTR